MLIYAYVGAYLNNQKTIEKITGRNMVDYVNTLLPKNKGICFLCFLFLHLYTTFSFKVNDKEIDEV